jgi:hypothetical protein
MGYFLKQVPANVVGMKEVFSSVFLWIKFGRMRPLTKRLLFLGLAAFLLYPVLHAQGSGVVEGRIVNATNPGKAPAGVTVDVIKLTAGMSVLKSSTADNAGKFRIDGLPTDTMLLLRATYGSVGYYSSPTFDASGKARVEIQVYEPTTSMQGIRIDKAQIAFKLTKEGLSSREMYTFVNESKPPRSFMRADGNFRFSKATGITEPPQLDVTGPGSSMPVNQPPLESPDGQSYYSLYPLRPGTTAFEVSQLLPYQDGGYTYRKKFYQDLPSVVIGVIPPDMKLTGEGLTTMPDGGRDFAVYAAAPIQADKEVVWTFAGGTPVSEETAPEAPGSPMANDARIVPMPTLVGQNAMIIGPLLLIGLVLILWYAQNRVIAPSGESQEARAKELKARREQLLEYVAALDQKYESQAMNRRDYLRLREQAKRHLRRITMLLAKK